MEKNEINFIFIFIFNFCTHCARKIELSGCLRGNFSGHLIILGKKKKKSSTLK
jgi:hypothetical protein